MAMTLELSHQPMHPIFTPRCAGASRHGRLVRKCSAGACPPLGSGWGVAESTVPTRHTKSQLRLFKPWCAGNSRHERLL